MFRIVIPARHGSTRLPGKPLAQIAGKPMLQWVHELAVASAAAEVLVATDDERVAGVARQFGAAVHMTSSSHPSGTDRIAAVARDLGWNEQDIVVNLQGDQPRMSPQLPRQVAALLAQHPGAAIATLATPIYSEQELRDPGVVKVVADAAGRALYFSRAPIPFLRDSDGDGTQEDVLRDARRHIGLYAYRVGALRRLASLAPSRLEQIEMLEQLRALENGLEIRVADAVADAGPHVDTPADLERVSQLFHQMSEGDR